MRLVIGGAFQGKKAYVAEKYQLPNEKMTDGVQRLTKKFLTLRACIIFMNG